MAASSSSAFKRYDWEQPGSNWRFGPQDDNGNEGDSSDDDAEPSPEEAGAMLVELLLNLMFTNALSAKSLCLICHWASKAGAAGPVGEYALKPGAPSGHYRRKVDAANGVDLRKSAAKMFKLAVPQHCKYDLARTVHEMVVRLPHEELAREVRDQPDCVTGPVCETAAFKAHPVVRGHPGVPVMPVALYLDGISFTRRDSLLGIFVYSLVSMRRHLCAVLRRSHLCRCGCKGWCSLYPVFEALRWSFKAMACGHWPTQRHDGPWTEADGERALQAGRPLGFVGALLQVRGDWSEFSHTLGLADWNSRLHPCMFCHASRDNRFDTTGFEASGNPWGAVAHADMEAACQACEQWRLLDAAGYALVKAAMHYEKGSRGGGGLCLSADIPQLALLKGDRVEPFDGLQDVAKAFNIESFPVRLLFWRRSAATRCRRRNPILMAPEIGMTVNTLMVDKLHSLNLGPAMFWCSHALWRLILQDAWHTRASGEKLQQLSALQIRNELWSYYRDRRRQLPEKRITEVSDFTLRMLGKPGQQTLNTKAAETKGLVPFVQSLLQKHREALTPEEFAPLSGAGSALQEMFDILDKAPRDLDAATARRLRRATARHVVLSEQAGMVLKPKHHMVLHMSGRASAFGNPNAYSTFEDESINKLLKKVGEAAHRSVWEVRVLVQFDQVEANRSGFKRSLPMD